MGVYSTVDSGTRAYKSRFHKSISYRKVFDTKFGPIVPVMEKFVLPGDVWRIGGEVLIRFLPMVTPSLTPCTFKVRYFFVPLRMIEPNAELILTGSKDGHLYAGTLPEFKNFVADANKGTDPDAYKVGKYGLWDYFGIPCGDYESIKTNKCLPAQYWSKAYYRILWDYYFDENLNVERNYADFETYYASIAKTGADSPMGYVDIPKDYFSSSLPWQLKGATPTLAFNEADVYPKFGDDFFNSDAINHVGNIAALVHAPDVEDDARHGQVGAFQLQPDTYEEHANEDLQKWLNLKQEGVRFEGLGFNAADFRAMMAQTRIFERLARCGSRYTEYLKSNFGVAPADDTLQRPQYLGGWSLPILTTEVLQTAADGANPVGTMRGHGISRGGNRLKPFFAKEFGVIIGVAHIMPKIQYTQGIKREFSYKSRFDFFNPSFQHLSEQEVRNGELFVSFSDGKNDDTFGFQAYANELRSSSDIIVGDLRDTLSYWTQAIKFASRPNLNAAFLDSYTYGANFNQCFVANTAAARNIIVDFYNDLDVYRPMVRYSTPGLVDHL